jgi:hypothetical protein
MNHFKIAFYTDALDIWVMRFVPDGHDFKSLMHCYTATLKTVEADFKMKLQLTINCLFR